MKTVIAIFAALLLMSFFGKSLNAQQAYSKMKLSMADGRSIQGSKGTLERETVSLNVGHTMQTYSLDDVDIITARRGMARKYALGFGGDVWRLVWRQQLLTRTMMM